MKDTIVYLVRHSETLKIDGIKNIEEDNQISNEKIILSVEGENKARELSQREELNNIDVIWSSNYVRAISTAKYIAYKKLQMLHLQYSIHLQSRNILVQNKEHYK